MTYREAKNLSVFDDTCPTEDEQFSKEIHGYEWSEQYQGVILGAFYWGYTLLHIPGAILSAEYGGKYTLSIGILSTAILTLLTPLTIQYGGAGWLIALRVLEGFGEGTTFPALNTLLSAWIPLKERAKAAAFVYGGAQEFLCYKDPESHPFISDKEKSYLKKELNQLSRDKAIKKTPWLKICTSVPMIALVVAQLGHSFGYFTVVTDLPKYMADVLKFKIKENGLYSTLPYVAMWIMSIIFGTISDWMLTKKWISLTNSRKLFTTFSFTVPGVFLVVASFSGCDRMQAVLMFTVAMGFMGAYYSGMKANNLDLSPNFAGAIMAITNGIGAIIGIINPYIIGLITPNRTISEWRNVFYISCGFLTFTNIVYIIWGSAEKQPWDTPEEIRSIENVETEMNRVENETEENNKT
ncbi:unnamed protein product [Chironomus riparius]|uniref:Inorganic phosphate cotransporter n=1 Tax=Chironomus riparius TaxID=315576 RepID=A0A9N9RM21_9DIPT|nr:unnamed protein product [Chironomus riparius]